MQKLIDTVSSYYATGIQPQAKLFKVPSGQYRDRVVIIYPKTANQLVYVWADPPYQSWSDPQNLVTDSADYPCSAYMDANGNVYLVYTQQTTLALLELKMSFSSGSWSVGTVYTVYNAGENYSPSITKDSTDRLWISWTYYDSVTERYFVRVKSSTDDGATWGSGPSDPGTALTNGSASCYSQLLFQSPYIHCFYSDDSTLLAYRSFELSGSVWSSQQTVYSGSGIDDDFHADLSSDQKVGIVFPGSSSLLYKEFDGTNWSGVFTVEEGLPASPTIKFFDTRPFVFFAKNIGTGQNEIFYSYKEGTAFVTPASFEKGQKSFERVFCYDDSATEKYADLTTEASDSTPADVYHPTSNSLIKDAGDAFYMGMDRKFNLSKIVLATAGITGQVSWQYWNGESWTNFTPNSGAYHLDSLDKTVILWEDLYSAPSDWQPCPVNGVSKFWVRVLVTTGFTTPPVGTQITAVPEAKYLNVIR
ncbi:MAG: hypothetical protein AMJ73_04410 [candidate division Zixibacteria bacterium SM1_73]|nr:MAG: hypothetical protein AMJ73_04410 [candidate division Zixibacteria bacterium SM1_73]